MSSMEYWKGSVVKCTFPSDVITLEDKIKYRVENCGDVLDYPYEKGDTYISCSTLVLINDVLYDTRKLILFNPEDEGCTAKVKDDGIVEITASFYNGGGDISEVIYDLITNLKSEGEL